MDSLEFDELNLEIKLRKAISDLITPVISRTQEMSERMSELEKKNEGNNTRIEHLYEITDRNIMKIAMLESLDREVRETNARRRAEDSKFNHRLGSLSASFDTMSQELQLLHSHLESIENNLGKLKHSQEVRSEEQAKFKDSVTTQALKSHEYITKEVSTIREELEVKYDAFLKLSQEYSEHNFKVLPKIYGEIETLNRAQLKIKRGVERYFSQKADKTDLKEIIAQRISDLSAFERLLVKHRDTQKQLDELSGNLPLFMIDKITDVLYQVGDKHLLKKLMEIQHNLVTGQTYTEIKNENDLLDLLDERKEFHSRRIEVLHSTRSRKNSRIAMDSFRSINENLKSSRDMIAQQRPYNMATPTNKMYLEPDNSPVIASLSVPDEVEPTEEYSSREVNDGNQGPNRKGSQSAISEENRIELYHNDSEGFQIGLLKSDIDDHEDQKKSEDKINIGFEGKDDNKDKDKLPELYTQNEISIKKSKTEKSLNKRGSVEERFIKQKSEILPQKLSDKNSKSSKYLKNKDDTSLRYDDSFIQKKKDLSIEDRRLVRKHDKLAPISNPNRFRASTPSYNVDRKEYNLQDNSQLLDKHPNRSQLTNKPNLALQQFQISQNELKRNNEVDYIIDEPKIPNEKASRFLTKQNSSSILKEKETRSMRRESIKPINKQEPKSISKDDLTSVSREEDLKSFSKEDAISVTNITQDSPIVEQLVLNESPSTLHLEKKPSRIDLKLDLSSVNQSDSEDASYVSKLNQFSENIEGLQEDVKSLSDSLSQTNQTMFSMLVKNEETIKQQIMQSQQAYINNVKMLEEEVIQQTKKWIQDKNDMKSQVASLKDQVAVLNTSSRFLNNQEKQTGNQIASIFEAVNVIRILLEQDEEDRNSIQLSALTNSSQSSRSVQKIKTVVSLKPDCVSCTGSNKTVVNAFKMACLNYSPSPITYRFKLYTRRQMIEHINSITNSFF